MSRTPPNVVSIFGVWPESIGGNETFARELSRQLAGAGWNSVLCWLSEPPEKVRAFLSLPNVTLERFPCYPLGRQAVSGFQSILRRRRPRIVHLHFTDFLSPYPWMARLRGVDKVFFTDQGSRPEGFRAAPAPHWKRVLTRAINRPLSGVISCSEYKRSVMRTQRAMPYPKLLHIPNSVDLSRTAIEPAAREQFRRRLGVAEGDPLVLQVSQVIPEKGIADLLEAARLVLDAQPRARFAVAGKGPRLPEYVQQALAMGLDGKFTFTGTIQDPFGEGAFAAADVVCQLSRWEEAFGWVIAEGMAFEKPLVGTRVGGIPEIIEDGVTGYVEERGDVVGIAGRILALLRDPESRARMGRAGRRRVEDRFDLRKNVSRLLAEVYGVV